MEPSPSYRYVLAHTADISIGLGAVGALGIMLAALHSLGVLIPQFGVVIWVLLASLLAAAIGFVVGLFFIWHMVLGPVAAQLQGWPFTAGETVRILSGPHKDTITTVYEVWSDRGQVRVDLGREAKERVEDVYCAVAVCRARITEPSAAPNGGPTAQLGNRESRSGRHR